MVDRYLGKRALLGVDGVESPQYETKDDGPDGYKPPQALSVVTCDPLSFRVPNGGGKWVHVHSKVIDQHGLQMGKN